MKHVFECGIVATSNDGAGDKFLCRMQAKPVFAFPGIAALPDEFTVELSDHRPLDPEEDEKLRQLGHAMIAAGYEWRRRDEHENFRTLVRFRRRAAP